LRSALYLPICFAVLTGLSGCTLLNDNFRPVESGKFYRSAQMKPERLAWMTKKYGIRTVINLRGVHEDEAWYNDEIRVCKESDITHEDFSWTMSRIPEPDSLKRFLELCETAEKPILVHCQAGIHRAGTASAVYVLKKGESPKAAKGQFGIYFFDAPIGDVVDLYDGSTLPFTEWVTREYPAIYREHTGRMTEPK
jgi:protein tyrosine phosphatase (PTP) superfamily phosphohydrolase (DUF442 family)